jgi:hypothetical protein
MKKKQDGGHVSFENRKRSYWIPGRPTVSLDVIALVASSGGYERGHIEHYAAP